MNVYDCWGLLTSHTSSRGIPSLLVDSSILVAVTVICVLPFAATVATSTADITCLKLSS